MGGSLAARLTPSVQHERQVCARPFTCKVALSFTHQALGDATLGRDRIRA